MLAWLQRQLKQFVQIPVWIWFLLLIPGIGVILFALYGVLWERSRGL